VLRAVLISMLVFVGSACDSGEEGDKADEAVRAVERAHREAARKFERIGVAIRETAEDGSLLVNDPEAPDGGD
jgi:hypothetical protein